MNQYNSGFPDGYSFNRNIPIKSEGERIQEKQQQALNEIYKTIPSNLIKGNTLQYGEDGLPIIENDPLEQQYLQQQQQITLEQQMQNTISRPPPQQQQDNFFTAPSVRQRQQPMQQQPMQQMQQQQPMQQQPMQPMQQQQFIEMPLSQGSTAYHPVVKKMLNVFGLKKNSRHELEVYNENTGDAITYTMTLVSEELQSWAMMEGKNRMAIEPDVGAIYFELLFGCCSVIAIDGVPVFEIFNISIQDNEKYALENDSLDMSLRIRKIAARSLASLLWSDTIPFGDKLVEFYQEKVIGKKIQSSLDREISDKIRYVCPLDECDNYEFFKPIFENGIEKNYFCKYHGIPLVKTLDLMKELDVPLA